MLTHVLNKRHSGDLFNRSADFLRIDDEQLDPKMPGLVDVTTAATSTNDPPPADPEADAATTAEAADDAGTAKAEADGSGAADDEKDPSGRAAEAMASRAREPGSNSPTPIDRAKRLGPGGG